MSIFTIETYLAAGFSKKEVLDALIDLDNELISQVLAASPHTSSSQLQRLYATASMEVAVLIASRQDLPGELVARIIRSGKPVARQALFQRWTTNSIPALEISDELISYLTQQSWFSATHAEDLLNCMPESSKLRAVVQELASDYQLVTMRHAYKRNASRIHGIRYKSPYLIYKSEFGQEHQLSDRYLEKILYLKSDDLASCLHGHLSVFDYGDAIKISPAQLAPKVQELLGAADAGLIKLFLQMLPSWQGSIRELADTARSLSDTSTQNSKKPPG